MSPHRCHSVREPKPSPEPKTPNSATERLKESSSSRATPRPTEVDSDLNVRTLQGYRTRIVYRVLQPLLGHRMSAQRAFLYAQPPTRVLSTVWMRHQKQRGRCRGSLGCTSRRAKRKKDRAVQSGQKSAVQKGAVPKKHLSLGCVDASRGFLSSWLVIIRFWKESSGSSSSW